MDAPTMNAFRILVYFTLMIGSSQATYKRFLGNTNFDNPDNWNFKRPPCASDSVFIPEESPVVYVQTNSTISKLTLPKTGDLVFGSGNVGFSFYDPSTESAGPADCPHEDGEIEFTAVHPKSWVNPSNWCPTSSATGNCDVSTPYLDVERIPCSYDDVVFPKNSLFFVDLNQQVPKLTMKSLKISGTSFTKNSFATYLTSNDGRRMFKTSNSSTTRTVVDITRKTCDDMAGCACGNDQPSIAKRVCSYVQKMCQRPACRETIQPVGACCKMCGAILNITRGYGFNFESFKRIVDVSFFKVASTRKEVNMTISLTYDGFVQIVLTDLSGEKSTLLARKIKEDMDKDMADTGHKYAISAASVSFSTGKPLTPSGHKSGEPLGKGAIAGIVIAMIIILLVLAVVVIVFLYHRSGREIPINLPKMPSMPTLPRIPIRTPRATARVPAQPQTAAHVDPGFANPLYDTSPFDDRTEVFKEMEFVAASREDQPTFETTGGGFNNPLYGAPGAAMFSDPTKSDDKQIQEKPTKAEGKKKKDAEPNVLVDLTKDNAEDSTI